MNARLLLRLLKPRRLPPPDSNCRTYDIGQVVYLLRNHERSKQQSQQLHQPRKPQ